MKQKSIIGFLLFVSLLCMVACNGVDYAEIMQKKVKAVFGDLFDGYTWFSYPTNNYGLLTCYRLTSLDKKPNHGDTICSMWSCIDVQVPEIPTDEISYLSMNGFVDYGDHGGSIELTESEEKDVTFKAVLPKIKELLNISAGIDWSKGTKTNLTIGQAYPRRLNQIKMIDYINGLESDHLIKRAYENGQLAIIAADVLIRSMTITISVDKNSNSDLVTELDGKLGDFISDEAKLEVNISSSLSGTYKLSINKPVILAALTVIQPQGGVLLAEDVEDPYDWSQWKVTKLSDDILKK